MIISHRHRFIFLKTQKCAGTSAELALSQVCGPDDVITDLGSDEHLRIGRGPQNYDIPESYRPLGWQLRQRLGAKASRRAMRFYAHMPAGEIRRSMDPAVFDAYRKITIVRNPWDRIVSLYFWHYRNCASRPSFDWFVRLPRYRPTRKTFDLYSINGEIVASDVLRFERLQYDLDALITTLDVDTRPRLPRAKGTHRPRDAGSYRGFYSDETRNIVAKRYAREIEAFSYEF